jgi:hypothetical protein
MLPYLLAHYLDEDLFPEFEREPGDYDMRIAIVDPTRDKRIPAPDGVDLVLLASYELLDDALPEASALHLAITGQRPGLGEVRTVYDLIEPAPEGDNIVEAEPDPALATVPGVINSGVFWVHIAPLLHDGVLRPGDTLSVRYGPVSASLPVPRIGPSEEGPDNRPEMPD